MKITINNQEISYYESGSGQAFVILHGWGCNKEMFAFMHSHFNERFRVITVDLPGFGESSEPKEVWGSHDYAACIRSFLKEIKAENPIVFGHSFGGRVLLAFGEKADFDKVILTGSAGLVPKRPLSYYFRVYRYKAAKWIYLHTPLRRMYPQWLENKRKHSGSADYRQASEMMRKIMVKVINEDLAEDITKINAPTILLWGTEDTATPIADGKRMEKLLKDGALIPLEGGSHYAILEQQNKCLAIMDAFACGKS